jgi:hypothetical protein
MLSVAHRSERRFGDTEREAPAFDLGLRRGGSARSSPCSTTSSARGRRCALPFAIKIVTRYIYEVRAARPQLAALVGTANSVPQNLAGVAAPVRPLPWGCQKMTAMAARLVCKSLRNNSG